MGDLLIEDRDGCMHDPIKTAEMLDGYADHASAGMDDSLYDAADVMRGLVNRLDDAEARAADADRNAQLRSAQLLMVGSEACGDPKLDSGDTGDPRWTPTLRDVAAMRAEVERLRVAAREVLRLHDAARAGDSVTTREVGAAYDALRAAIAAEDGTVQA